MTQTTETTTGEQEAFFLGMMDEIKRLTEKYPSITNMECVAILTRMVGMCIAASDVNERGRMRELAINNMDRAVEHFPIYDRN